MRIVEFTGGTLRFLEALPSQPPERGFIWLFLDRESLAADLPALHKATLTLGGSAVLDLHVKDLGNRDHPSQYDFTSVYDLLVLRRLATDAEVRAEVPHGLPEPGSPLATFARIQTRAVGFVVFDKLLVSVHPAGCYTADTFIKRFLEDAVQSDGLGSSARNRMPQGTADLMLRMVNVMVDSYLDIRKPLATELDQWQAELLSPRARAADWRAFMSARKALHTLEDLSEGQQDAVQEWLDTWREQPAGDKPQVERDSLVARARDVIEHIDRVVRHVQRMEQAAETAVQIHFSVQGHRTNEIMRVLTALTAVFLPLNFMTGFFGMNFEFLPLIHSAYAMWAILGTMVTLAVLVLAVFWRKRYLARTR